MKALKLESASYIKCVEIAIHHCYATSVEPSNEQLMALYQTIGQAIVSQGEKAFVVFLADYLKSNFLSLKGFSPRNLRRMRNFYLTYQNDASLMTEALQLNWTQNVIIMEYCESNEERSFYIALVGKAKLSKLALIAEIEMSASNVESEENIAEVTQGVVVQVTHIELEPVAVEVLYTKRYAPYVICVLSMKGLRGFRCNDILSLRRLVDWRKGACMKTQERTFSLENSTLVLRNPTEQDASMMLAYLKTVSSESKFLLNEPEEITFTIEGERKFIDMQNESADSITLIGFLDGEYVGNCSLMGMQKCRYKHRAGVAIALFQKYTGQGIGSVMLGQLCEIAKSIGLEQLELEVVASNVRAIALYKKIGFEIHGTFPNHMKYRDGSYADEYFMVKVL